LRISRDLFLPMSRRSAKRIAARNRVVVRNLFAGEAVALALTLALCAASPRRAAAQLAKAAPELLGVFFLYRVSRPGTEAGRVVDGGTLLDRRGAVALCFDFVYVSWAVRAASLLSAWAYLLYAVLAISLCYEFVPRALGVFR
jgi:hypothetical protein